MGPETDDFAFGSRARVSCTFHLCSRLLYELCCLDGLRFVRLLLVLLPTSRHSLVTAKDSSQQSTGVDVQSADFKLCQKRSETQLSLLMSLSRLVVFVIGYRIALGKVLTDLRHIDHGTKTSGRGANANLRSHPRKLGRSPKSTGRPMTINCNRSDNNSSCEIPVEQWLCHRRTHSQSDSNKTISSPYDRN